MSQPGNHFATELRGHNTLKQHPSPTHVQPTKQSTWSAVDEDITINARILACILAFREETGEGYLFQVGEH